MSAKNSDKTFNYLILAAGLGNRMKKISSSNPKILFEFNKRRLIDYHFENLKEYKKSKIYIVGGYNLEKIKKYLKGTKVNFFKNKEFRSTNMYYSFSLAKKLLNQNKDLIISYGDIIFKKEILKKILNNKIKFDVCIDKDFLRYWKLRMKKPMKDLESLIIKQNEIKEIGKKTSNYKFIQGQYIGLMKIPNQYFKKILKLMEMYKLKKNYKQSYFTEFLQFLIDNGVKLRPLFHQGGWQEFDSPKDLKIDNFNF